MHFMELNKRRSKVHYFRDPKCELSSLDVKIILFSGIRNVISMILVADRGAPQLRHWIMLVCNAVAGIRECSHVMCIDV
jgi:hypothetical protein